MCFFKAKLPAAVNPDATQALPTIQETKAPEPTSPIFGGTEADLKDAASRSAETGGKRGISSLKIATEAPAVSTGANMGASGVRM